MITQAGRQGRIRGWTHLTAEALWRSWRQQFDSDDDAIAHAVWMANRLVKDKARTTKVKFYSIKDAFISRYSNAGRRVREEIKYCYACDGTGKHPYYDDEPCDRCIDGVYSRRWLYLYEFHVAGTFYRLHSYVEPEVILDGEAGDNEQFGERFTDDEFKMLALPISGLLRMLGYIAAAKWKMILIDGRYWDK